MVLIPGSFLLGLSWVLFGLTAQFSGWIDWAHGIDERLEGETQKSLVIFGIDKGQHFMTTWDFSSPVSGRWDALDGEMENCVVDLGASSCLHLLDKKPAVAVDLDSVLSALNWDLARQQVSSVQSSGSDCSQMLDSAETIKSCSQSLELDETIQALGVRVTTKGLFGFESLNEAVGAAGKLMAKRSFFFTIDVLSPSFWRLTLKD